MLKIRLQRVGRKNDPAFRIVLTESTNSTKSGKFLEILGTYNPKTKERAFKSDRISYWIGEGAKPTDSVHNLLVKEKLMEGKTVNVLPKKEPTKSKKELKAEA